MDETLRLVTEYKSQRLEAAWYMPDGGRARVGIGNSSASEVRVVVVEYSGRSRDLTIAAHATKFLEIPRTRSGHDDSSFATLSIVAQADAGVVQAMGYVTGHEGGTRTIRFYDPATMRSADLFATNLPINNRQVRLVLRNIGTKTITAHPIFRSATTGALFTDIQPVQLLSGEARVVDTTTLSAKALNDPDFSSVSAQVVNDGDNGSLIGALSSNDDENHLTYDLPLRDRGSLMTSGGSYPIRLDGDYRTTVSITNVTSDSAQFTGVVRNEHGPDWVIAPRTLGAGETAVFDIGKLRDTQTKDAAGHTLPLNMTRGQFNWTMLSGGSTPRLIGRSHLVSENKGVSASYSCWVCCTNGPYHSSNPDFFSLLPAQFGNTTSRGSTMDCYGNQSFWPEVLSFTDADSSVAYTSTDSQYTWVHAMTAGSTSHEYDYYYDLYRVVAG